jgi:hypothetical protein
MICQECGMPCEPAEYHPYGACLMFKACLNSATVRASLDAIREHGRQATATQPAQRDALAKMIADLESEQTFLGSSRDTCSESDKQRWDRMQVIADHLSQQRGA